MPDEQQDRPEDRDDEDIDPIDDAVARYIDDLTAGRPVHPMQVLLENPGIGDAVVERLEEFISLRGDDQIRAPLGALGDYTLRRQVGRGGMGVVYEAWQNSLERRVALKVLPAGVAVDSKAFLRFMREAKTAAQLHHQNVVAVYGMGVEANTPYYAMEFVEGETLARILSGLKKAPPEEKTAFGFSREDVACTTAVARAFAEAADGLQHAHSKGVIHRDIKPSNLILDRDLKAQSPGGFTLRILDFGLARWEGQTSLTASGDFMGTVLYMSPEQARRKKIAVDHRTDIYSLGATLYEVLTGRPPFQGKDHEDTITQIIQHDPRPPRQLNSRVPRELETIVMKCLRKDPADRYGTAEALAQDLRRFVRGDPVEARPESRWEKLSRRLRRNRVALLAAGVLVILLGALGWSDLLRRIAKEEAREAARLLHDATVRDAAIEGYSGQLTLLGQEMSGMGTVLFLYRGGEFGKGPAGVQGTLSTLERAADAVAQRPDAPYYLALCFRLAGDVKSAAREAARALERDGDFVPAEVLSSEIALARGPLGDAEIEGILARFKGKPGWQEPWLLAYRHVKARRLEEAAAAYGRLLVPEFREKKEPYVGFTVDALMGRGIVRYQTQNFPGAISDFAAARAIWPRLREAALGLGVAWYKAGHAEEAEAIFSQLHAESPEKVQSEIASWIVAAYDSLGDEMKADEWTDRMVEWERSFRNSWLLYWQNRFEEADEEARKALEAGPDELLPLIGLASTKMKLQWGRRGPRWDGERRQILDLARKASTLYPNYPFAKYFLAMGLQLNGRPQEALSTIEGAVRLRLQTGEEDINDPIFHSIILHLQGDMEGTEQVILKALEKWPESGGLQHELGWLYYDWGRDAEAEKVLRALIDGGAAPARDYSNLAGVLNRLGRYEEAAEVARDALQRPPKNTAASGHLARALWKLGRVEEALRAADSGIRALPDRECLHLVKGRILEDLGRPEEAAKAYSQELLLRLEDVESHEVLCRLLKARPELASSEEVRAVGEAIERRRSAGSCGALLVETLALIRKLEREEVETSAPAGN